MFSLLHRLLLTIAVTTAPVFSQIQYGPRIDFSTGEGPISVVLGDFNGDGRLDIVSANYKANTLSLLLNVAPLDGSNPTFISRAELHAEEKPIAVAVGDFNGDGKPDIVVANYLSNSISIFVNTSRPDSITPSFAIKEDFPTEERPIALFVDDFNGDGRPDLAVANYKSNSISIFLNTTLRGSSSISFAPRADLATGTRPVFVAGGDLNGDGRSDLVAVNYRSDSISIFFNETSANSSIPEFSKGVNVLAGERPMSAAVGDVNSDGMNDILVANQGSNSISVLMNAPGRGKAMPSFVRMGELITGESPQSVVFVDATENGGADIAAGNYNSGTVSIFVNTTSHGAEKPSFFLKKDISAGLGPTSLVIGSLTGSGLKDLVLANYGSNTVSVFFNIKSSNSQPVK